jgi:hypothetical protein
MLQLNTMSTRHLCQQLSQLTATARQQNSHSTAAPAVQSDRRHMSSCCTCLLVLLDGERCQVIQQQLLLLLLLHLGLLTLVPLSGALTAGRKTVRSRQRRAWLLSFLRLLLC